MITKKTKYGLNAILALARWEHQEWVGIAELAQRERIPLKFLELILLELKNAGLLQSRRGPSGGYALAKSADDITVGQVLRILDGPLAPVSCVSQTAYKACDECGDVNRCGLHKVMQEARDAMAAVFDRTSLADVNALALAGTVSAEPAMFHI